MAALAFAEPSRAATSVNTTSETTTDAIVINAPTTNTVQVTEVDTTIEGELAGGEILYDQTFPDPFSSAPVQAGLASARLAITAAGGPGVVILGPTLVDTSTTTTSTTTSDLYSLDKTVVTISVVTVIGPATVYYGDRDSCGPAIASLPSSTRPVCGPPGGSTLVVVPGGQNINTTYNATYYVNELETTTNTTTTDTTYLLEGVVKPIGTVHAAEVEAGFDAGDRFVRRLLDASDGAGATPPLRNGDPFWIEGYGWWSRTAAQGEFPGDATQGGGISGGLDYHFGGFTLGAALDYGSAGLSEGGADETGSLRLFQAGAYGSWRSGTWFADVAGAYGWGRAGTTASPPLGPGPVTTESSGYDANVADAAIEAGDHVVLPGLMLTPSIGGSWTQATSGAFTETGSALDLTAPSHAFDRYKGWLGLAAETTEDVGNGGSVSFRAYGRAVLIGGDEEVRLPVAFAAYPTQLTLDGPSTGSFGGDLGAAVAYHFGRSAEAYAAYDADLRDRYLSQTASVGLKVAF
jgi:hypothetical protein